MTIKTGSAWAGLFVTLDATGAKAASTDAAGTLYVDGVADAATVTISGSNPYKWSVTLPALTAGQRVDMYITGTIGTIATAGIVASAQADTVLLSDGVTLADDAITASKFDESTAFPVKSADTGATAIARVGADGDTLETLSDQLDTIKTKTDLLDVSAITVVTAVNGTTITVLRGDTLSVDVANLGSLETYVSLDFTVKKNAYQTDDEAIIRIRKNVSGTGNGLLRLNGAAHTTGTDGTLTITDAPTGDVTIMLKAGVTDDLVPGTYVYDIQLIEANEVSTLTTGTLIVSADVTRLIA